MKVRTKLALLLLALIAIFLGGLIALKAYDRGTFEAATSARQEQLIRSFDKFLQRWSESLKIFTNDFSCRDDVVAATTSNGQAWAEANLAPDTLATYRADAVWGYGKDGARVFAKNNLYSDGLQDVPLPPGAMPQLLDQARTCHFFAWTELGLMEIRGATIHPSTDSARRTPPAGYLLAARLWNSEDVRDMSRFTGNDIRIETGDAANPPARKHGSPVVSFSRVLPGWDGKPLAALAVHDESPVVGHLNRSSKRQFFWIVAFVVVLFLVGVISLTRVVSSPLKKVSTCLKLQDPAPVIPLQRQHCEFGDIARMIGAFFAQREDLLREISERRQTQLALRDSEERLRHSQKMEAVGRLAGGVAHDFNNLLTAIIGYAELISSRVTDKNVRQDADMIRKAGEQAADLTRQLLAFSRKQLLQPRVIDLNTLVQDMQKLLQRVIGEHIELRVETAAEGARVRADPTQLEQVIINLGVNARDAMPQGGTLTMRTANVEVAESFGEGGSTVPPGRYITLSVQDTGCGMDDETKERIFEPFFTTKGPGKGTGLGLATVYGIVRQSGGAILVDSAPGEGTTLTVYLPREEAPIEPARVSVPPTEKGHHSETVLVVEDEQMVRELVCAVLSDQGYNVICAANGNEGLRLAREHNGDIDLLVSDLIMPQMNGPEVARKLHATRPGTRLLFVSGYSNNDISDQGVLQPGIQFLEKPFTPQTLAAKVREVLDQPEAVENAAPREQLVPV